LAIVVEQDVRGAVAIVIDGKRHAWRYILKLRREQSRQRAKPDPRQLTLFPVDATRAEQRFENAPDAQSIGYGTSHS
jgi:hypothetical protein